MSINSRSWGWYFGLGIAIGGVSAASANRALSQELKPVPDNTLGAESSFITPINGQIDQINGGAIRGANLFHSFSQFHVGEGREARFAIPDGIRNILTRVTGTDPSQIFGKLSVLGEANLFLINSNGIIFGPNASLDIRGSFLASTASSLNFADGTLFNATAPQTTPLLTISVPVGLQFGVNPGEIRVQGNGQGLRTESVLIDTNIGLRVPSNQTLALVGGDVVLDGGTLKTAGGRIELGSVADSSLVSLTEVNKGWALNYAGVTAFKDIQLSQQAAVDASGLGGGDIQVQGRRVTLSGVSQIEASTLGSEPGGTLSLRASESVELIGTPYDSAFILTTGLLAQVYPEATGAGGNLIVETPRLNVRDGAQIQATTFGIGKAGNLTVNASEFIELIGVTPDERFSSTLATTVAIPQATGAGGNLTVNTRRLSVRNGAQVQAGTFGSGASGDLIVNVSELIELIGTSTSGKFSSGLSTSVAQGEGAGGNLTVNTQRLSVRDGALVSSATQGRGLAGNLTVNASEFVELSGISDIGGQRSSLTASTLNTGNAGNIKIETGRLTIQNGAEVSSFTGESGSAGNLTVNASELVELSGTSVFGSSRLTARTFATRNAGNIRIETERLTLQDGAEVSVSGNGSGSAGNLTVTANDIRLNRGSMTATTDIGDGANIRLQNVDLLLLQNQSLISAQAFNNANGGNVNIDAANGVVIAVPGENNDIIASAVGGQGGEINITTSGIFGIEERRATQGNITNDIDASSEFGLPGTVIINRPEVEPVEGLLELPEAVVDVSGLVDTGCAAFADAEGSAFFVTGRSGLPPSPDEPLSTDVLWSDTRMDKTTAQRSQTLTTKPAADINPSAIVPATGWMFNGKGEVTLISHASGATSLGSTSATCHQQ